MQIVARAGQIQVLLFGTLWKFFFFVWNIFDLRLVESVAVEPPDKGDKSLLHLPLLCR